MVCTCLLSCAEAGLTTCWRLREARVFTPAKNLPSGSLLRLQNNLLLPGAGWASDASLLSGAAVNLANCCM